MSVCRTIRKPSPLSGFSRQCESTPLQCITASLPVTPQIIRCVDLPAHPTSTLGWPCHLTTELLLLRHHFAPASKGRNINRLPIRYGFRLSLRVSPNPGWISLPQVTLGFRGEGFSPSSRYSCLHSHLDFVQQPSRVCLLPTQSNAPLPTYLTYAPQFR